MSCEFIWGICASVVDNPSIGRVSKARGTCTANTIISLGLTFDANGKPHERHANVINWPKVKHEQMMVQQKLAEKMTLEVRI